MQISAELRRRFAEAKRVLVLTGAGVSAESGVPTFRGGGNTTVWKGMPFDVISSAEMIERDLPAVWEWFDYRRDFMGLRVSPDARPEQGSFYRSDHFPFAKVGVPSISLKEGSDYVGRSKEWGQEQFKAYNTAHYHQPSDEFRDSCRWSSNSNARRGRTCR